jgi:hypothetical protein
MKGTNREIPHYEICCISDLLTPRRSKQAPRLSDLKQQSMLFSFSDRPSFTPVEHSPSTVLISMLSGERLKSTKPPYLLDSNHFLKLIRCVFLHVFNSHLLHHSDTNQFRPVLKQLAATLVQWTVLWPSDDAYTFGHTALSVFTSCTYDRRHLYFLTMFTLSTH